MSARGKGTNGASSLSFVRRYPPLDEGKVAWLERLVWSKPSKRHFGY